MKYTVQHIGYPTTANIDPASWKTYSVHATESAAWKRIEKATSGLGYGSWNDHYRVIDSNGRECSKREYYSLVSQEDDQRRVRRMK